jgi:uncharacterized membrane protein YhfC
MLGNLVMVLTLNSGGFDGLIATAPEQAEVLNTAAAVFVESSPLDLSPGLAERIVAMVLHISLSVIVFCAVRQRKWIYLLLAIALHALANCCVLFFVSDIVTTWGLELILAIAATAVALIAWRIARTYRPQTIEQPQSAQRI